jgi:ribosomal protein S27AE
MTRLNGYLFDQRKMPVKSGRCPECGQWVDTPTNATKCPRCGKWLTNHRLAIGGDYLRPRRAPNRLPFPSEAARIGGKIAQEKRRQAWKISNQPDEPGDGT